MVGYNMRAFSTELANIKVAQAELSGDKPGRERWKDVAKALAQNVGAGALGAGIGTALGAGAGELVRRSGLTRSLTPSRLKTLRRATGVMGTIGGLAILHAMNQAQKRVDKVPK